MRLIRGVQIWTQLEICCFTSLDKKYYIERYLSSLSNTAVIDYIRSQHYDVAIVDLIQNECMHALPVSMGVPVIGFWLTLPTGMSLG